MKRILRKLIDVVRRLKTPPKDPFESFLDNLLHQDREWQFFERQKVVGFQLEKIKLFRPVRSGYLHGETYRELCLPQNPLGADEFFYFWQNRNQIPESWKEPNTEGNFLFITFDADVVVGPYGRPSALYLWWGGSGWTFSSSPLHSDVSPRRVSACLGNNPQKN